MCVRVCIVARLDCLVKQGVYGDFACVRVVVRACGDSFLISPLEFGLYLSLRGSLPHSVYLM